MNTSSPPTPPQCFMLCIISQCLHSPGLVLYRLYTSSPDACIHQVSCYIPHPPMLAFTWSLCSCTQQLTESLHSPSLVSVLQCFHSPGLYAPMLSFTYIVPMLLFHPTTFRNSPSLHYCQNKPRICYHSNLQANGCSKTACMWPSCHLHACGHHVTCMQCMWPPCGKHAHSPIPLVTFNGFSLEQSLQQDSRTSKARVKQTHYNNTPSSKLHQVKVCPCYNTNYEFDLNKSHLHYIDNLSRQDPI